MGKGALQERLLHLAASECLPFVLSEDRIRGYADQIAFLLVGSVATGLCNDHSDIDIALVSDEDVYRQISRGTSRSAGKPSEAKIGGVQLHYFGVSIRHIVDMLKELDDVHLYVYGNALVLRESASEHARQIFDLLGDRQQLRRQRTEGKLDMLLRRRRALRASVKSEDPIVVCRMLLEVITIALKVTALLDDIPFDPRKRLFRTALSGPTGGRLAASFEVVFGQLGILACHHDLERCSQHLLHDIEGIIDTLSTLAGDQGFRVGLARPDMRHAEG